MVLHNAFISLHFFILSAIFIIIMKINHQFFSGKAVLLKTQHKVLLFFNVCLPQKVWEHHLCVHQEGIRWVWCWCHLPPVLLCSEEERESVVEDAEADLPRYVSKANRDDVEEELSQSLGRWASLSLRVSPGSFSPSLQSLIWTSLSVQVTDG